MSNVRASSRPAGVSSFEYAKKAFIAGIAGATATLASLVVAVTAGSDAGVNISVSEWLQTALVGLSAVAGTFGVYVSRNKYQ